MEGQVRSAHLLSATPHVCHICAHSKSCRKSGLVKPMSSFMDT